MLEAGWKPSPALSVASTHLPVILLRWHLLSRGAVGGRDKRDDFYALLWWVVVQDNVTGHGRVGGSVLCGCLGSHRGG